VPKSEQPTAPKTPQAFPATLYVRPEPFEDNDAPGLGDFAYQTSADPFEGDDGEWVGIYELVGKKKLAITRKLV